MSNAGTSTAKASELHFNTRYLGILGCFSLLLVCSLPLILSFDLWVMGDKSSFLNLDYLFQKHYAIGTDVCYSYGLLPLMLEDIVFRIFGKGFMPMIGCTIVVLLISALFWALLSKRLPGRDPWLLAIAAVTPNILFVNPNFPYSLVVLSMLFALLFVWDERFDDAFACAVVGCFCVPSLPLVLSGLLAILIVVAWWTSGDRRFAGLIKQLAPGLILYLSLFVILGLYFGFPSVRRTILPINGAKFYQSTGWGAMGASMVFFHPPGNNLKYYIAYYLFTPVTWFSACLLFLVVMGVRAALRMARERRVDGPHVLLSLTMAVFVVFILVAFGGGGQQEIYQPVLVAAVLVGISLLSTQWRKRILTAFIVLGLAGETWQGYKTLNLWRTTRPGPDTMGLYADPQFMVEWSKILDISTHRRTLMLSFGTGAHHYYPTVRSPEVWFLLPGLMFQSEKQRLFDQMDHADVIVEDLTRNHAYVDYDQELRAHLAGMEEQSVTRNFRIFQRVSGPNAVALPIIGESDVALLRPPALVGPAVAGVANTH